MCVLPYVLELKSRTLFLNTHRSEISAYFKSLRRGRRPSHCATSRAYADKNYIRVCRIHIYLGTKICDKQRPVRGSGRATNMPHHCIFYTQ